MEYNILQCLEDNNITTYQIIILDVEKLKALFPIKF